MMISSSSPPSPSLSCSSAAPLHAIRIHSPAAGKQVADDGAGGGDERPSSSTNAPVANRSPTPPSVPSGGKQVPVLPSDDDDDSPSNSHLLAHHSPSHTNTNKQQSHIMAAISASISSILLFITFKSILEPNQSRAKLMWDWWIVLLALHSIFLVPWYIAFDPHVGRLLDPFDWMVTVCMALDVVVTLRTGFVDYSGNAVFDAVLIRKRYMESVFVIDVISAFPLHVFAPLCNFGSEDFMSACFKANWLLRLTKIMYSERVGSFISPRARIMKLLFGFFYLAHLFGSLFFLVGNVQTDTVTWVDHAQLRNAPAGDQYLACIYWALTTMVTVGYGDIVPRSTWERAVVVPILLLSALVYATIFGNMAYAIETITSTVRRYQSRMDQVKEFIKVYELPPELQRKLFDYTNAMWNQNKGFENEQMLQNLPVSVKAEVMMFLHQTLIQRVPLFKQCSDRFLEAIILRMSSQVCLPGDYVFKEGDKSREMYFVRSGSFHIIMEDPVTHSDNIIAEIGSYSEYPFFGEISLLLGETRTASARAVSKSVLSTLSQQDFFDVLSMFPDEENSLRETATMRLQQDIEREQKALEKRKKHKRTDAINSSPQLNSYNSGDKLQVPGHVSSSSSSDLLALPGAALSTKSEVRLRAMEGGHAPSGSVDFSARGDASPRPTHSGHKSEVELPKLTSASLDARAQQLNKLNNTSVRQSIFMMQNPGAPGITGFNGDKPQFKRIQSAVQQRPKDDLDGKEETKDHKRSLTPVPLPTSTTPPPPDSTEDSTSSHPGGTTVSAAPAPSTPAPVLTVHFPPELSHPSTPSRTATPPLGPSVSTPPVGAATPPLTAHALDLSDLQRVRAMRDHKPASSSANTLTPSFGSPSNRRSMMGPLSTFTIANVSERETILEDKVRKLESQVTNMAKQLEVFMNLAQQVHQESLAEKEKEREKNEKETKEKVDMSGIHRLVVSPSSFTSTSPTSSDGPALAVSLAPPSMPPSTSPHPSARLSNSGSQSASLKKRQSPNNQSKQ